MKLVPISSANIVQRFRAGLVFKAHKLCVSLNSRLESNDEEEKTLSVKTFHPKSTGNMRNKVERDQKREDFLQPNRLLQKSVLKLKRLVWYANPKTIPGIKFLKGVLFSSCQLT